MSLQYWASRHTLQVQIWAIKVKQFNSKHGDPPNCSSWPPSPSDCSQVSAGGTPVDHVESMGRLTEHSWAELFLYGFIVPILPYMLQKRIGVNKKETQSITSNLLGIFAGIQVLMAPVIGILSDKTSRRKVPLLFGLSIALAGTILMATTLRSTLDRIDPIRSRLLTVPQYRCSMSLVSGKDWPLRSYGSSALPYWRIPSEVITWVRPLVPSPSLPLPVSSPDPWSVASCWRRRDTGRRGRLQLA